MNVAKLNEYAQRQRLELKYEDVGSVGPDHIKTFTVRAVVDGKVYPDGVGKNKKEAKQNAARNALRCLLEEPIDPTGEEKYSGTPSKPKEESNQNVLDICEKTKSLSVRTTGEVFTDTNYIGMINSHCQRTKLSHDYILEKRCGPPHNPQFFYKLVINNKEYPVGEGKSAKEAKQKAAQLALSALQEQTDWDSKVSVWPAVSEDSAPAKLSTPPSTPFTLDFDSIVSLGKGAFGQVSKAKHKLLKKYYAVKIVRCKEIKKALREVRALSDLHHGNIVRYYTCWLEDSGYQWEKTDDSGTNSQSTGNSLVKYLYIQMELCDTRTLRVWIDEKNIQNVKKSLRDSKRRDESLIIAQQMVSAVEYIHSKMLIHRDLKPANIMFGQDGEVKIGDFGLVTAENNDDAENLLERSVYKGTPSYMAPEQKRKNTYDRKVDIFALGLIYFELLWNLSVGNERNVREGNHTPTVKATAKHSPSILQRAFDWEMQVDLRSRLVFPQDIAATSLRPDLVLISRITKTILVAELTVPWEDRLAISHQIKKAKYQDLIDEALIKGWHATNPIEVGCRGFPATSLRYFLQKVGLDPKHLKKATREITVAAETSSRWLWLKRAHSWNPSAGEG
ncbi:hypothetical protein EPR50_G00176520 [Perca flavescens]|uniref:Eukaryotic translation initiation factor 2-alpha kinase 2 n=1 Tax=Perca flavescens TaxID=8167 RepID=A0A484CBC1_PERFV|nr:hypothetical protein EPR50_G00176520 [Perca flavescens]